MDWRGNQDRQDGEGLGGGMSATEHAHVEAARAAWLVEIEGRYDPDPANVAYRVAINARIERARADRAAQVQA